MKRILCLLILLLTVIPQLINANTIFEIKSLEVPVNLIGDWLFTRVDHPNNASVELNTENWKKARAPGSWKKIYEDGQNFTVGWHRGTLKFAPQLIGKEVVILLDTYMAKVNVYLDGREIYRRVGGVNTQRYYSIQPIPVRFKVEKEEHLLVFRVETILMKGVYQLPFQIREYQPDDKALAWFQFYGGELRSIAAFVSLFAGLFFFLVFLKTRDGLYLHAALAGIIISLFFGATADYLLKFFQEEKLLIIHYSGLFAIFFLFRFSQYFYRHTPRINLFLGVPYALIASYFILVAPFSFNLSVFQTLRTLIFLMSLAAGVMTFYIFVRGALEKRRGALIMAFGLGAFLYAGVSDLALALDIIDAIGIFSIGTMIAVSCMMWVVSNIFADTFVENKTLAKNLQKTNENLRELNVTLEDKVRERTADLAASRAEIKIILEQIPLGILTLNNDKLINQEHSDFVNELFPDEEAIASKELGRIVYPRMEQEKERRILLEYFDLAYDLALDWEMIAGIAPRIIEYDIKNETYYYKLEFNRIEKDNEVTSLLVIITDVTSQTKLEEKLKSSEKAHNQEMEIISAALSL